MNFEMLDGYLLDGSPAKSQVVRALLEAAPNVPGAAAFYTGLESLGEKTPDLALIALRLVLAGKKADDEAVTRVRSWIEMTRGKGPEEAEARAAYHREFGVTDRNGTAL